MSTSATYTELPNILLLNDILIQTYLYKASYQRKHSDSSTLICVHRWYLPAPSSQLTLHYMIESYNVHNFASDNIIKPVE